MINEIMISQTTCLLLLSLLYFPLYLSPVFMQEPDNFEIGESSNRGAFADLQERIELLEAELVKAQADVEELRQGVIPSMPETAVITELTLQNESLRASREKLYDENCTLKAGIAGNHVIKTMRAENSSLKTELSKVKPMMEFLTSLLHATGRQLEDLCVWNGELTVSLDKADKMLVLHEGKDFLKGLGRLGPEFFSSPATFQEEIKHLKVAVAHRDYKIAGLQETMAQLQSQTPGHPSVGGDIPEDLETENTRLVGELNEVLDRLHLFQGFFQDYQEFRRLRSLEKDLTTQGATDDALAIKSQLRPIFRRLKEAFANLGDGYAFAKE